MEVPPSTFNVFDKEMYKLAILVVRVYGLKREKGGGGGIV